MADSGFVRSNTNYLKIKTIMKTMKFSIITLLILFAGGILTAQEYKYTVQNPKDGRLILKDFSGTLPIEGYSGNDIIISSTAGNFTPPEKAKGLKPIYPSGSDNTGMGLDIQKVDNIITITCLVPFTQESEYKLRVPENMAIEVSSGCERNTDVKITGIKNEIDIETCHDIKLDNVTGPLVLSTISGNIDITYSNINTARSSSVNSVSGDIDITLPVKTAVNLELRVVSGAIYSDFDFAESQKNLKKVGGNETNYSLNGGGFKFNIGSVSGNIYLRKGN
jgi:lia operon protein LiaG